VSCRLTQDPHLRARTLCDELEELGYRLSYQTLTRQFRDRRLRANVQQRLDEFCRPRGDTRLRGVGGVADRFGVGRGFDQVGVVERETRVGWGERCDALFDGFRVRAVSPGSDDLLAFGYFGEDEAWSGVAAGEAVDVTMGVDDFGGRGEVDLNGVAEPEPMLRADPVVRW
jgi:hypothetical protein